jgi:hypothetical protein
MTYKDGPKGSSTLGFLVGHIADEERVEVKEATPCAVSSMEVQRAAVLMLRMMRSKVVMR